MIALLLSLGALARPTDGGTYAFDETDVIATYDGPLGVVRVTYSESGNNAVREGDDDADGVPDFVEEVAESAEDVLSVFEAAGFRAPVTEEEMGLDPAEYGGSSAFDFYLVDFDGVGDGQFSTDRCSDGVCSGYMVMENDFRGYGYSSISQAIRVLTSHELFHAVQYAYNRNIPNWMSEGTAVWAEHLYDPENEDFLWYCDAYLVEVARELDSPPAGAGSAYIYSTALFWTYLVEQYGVEVGAVGLMEAMVDRSDEEGVDAVEDVILAGGETLELAWARFARWNLATGDRAGLMDSYPFAAELDGIEAEAEGEAISDDNRFYPLAATYYRLDHAGGPLWFGSLDDPAGLEFSLHAVEGGESDGPVEEAALTWNPEGEGLVELGELSAGGWWLVGTFPTYAENSTKVQFCLGSEDAMSDCLPTDTGETGDTGDSGVDEETGEAKPEGCACGSGGRASWGWALALVGLVVRRRMDRGGGLS